MVCKTNNKNQQNNGAKAMKHKHFRSGCLLDKETITTIYLFYFIKKSWESRKVPVAVAVAVEEGLLH